VGGHNWYISRVPDPTPKKRRSLLPLAIVGVLILGALGTAWALRSTIATSLAQSELLAHGVTCDSRFSVEPSAFFGSATLAPTRCTPEQRGLLEAFELTAPATVELDGFSVSTIHAESVRLTLKDRDVRGGSEWSPQLERVNLEQRVAGLVKGMSELSRLELPPTTVMRTEVVRAGQPMAQLDNLSLTPGDSLTVGAERIDFSVVMGAGHLTLEDVHGTATRPHVHLEGHATARAAILIIATVSTGGPFRLDATALDTAQPRFVLEADF
jgi:hypothetical protein